MWDKERLKTELWASVRKLPNVGQGNKDDSSMPMTAILPCAMIYIVIGDIILLNITDASITDVDQLNPTIRRVVYACIGGATIALMMLYFFYLVLFSWAALTRQRTFRPSEWTMTTHRFPLFATDPADFWSQWHTLFKYIWVDFAYFPLRRFAQIYLGESRTGSKFLSKALELILPILGVFCLSGIAHGFCVWATWRESPWSQWNYFMLQACAVIATKAFQQTPPGRRWCRYYHTCSEQQRKRIDLVGMTAMIGYHILTSPPFIEPYARHEVWLGHRARSILWHLFGKHWSWLQGVAA
ncbi:hypothetical protein BGW42_002354 [Actinomortierella wolfii]|nr:hypothetical protein BGW42_002354 [Actinomortierella wolfii]